MDRSVAASKKRVSQFVHRRSPNIFQSDGDSESCNTCQQQVSGTLLYLAGMSCTSITRRLFHCSVAMKALLWAVCGTERYIWLRGLWPVALFVDRREVGLRWRDDAPANPCAEETPERSRSSCASPCCTCNSANTNARTDLWLVSCHQHAFQNIYNTRWCTMHLHQECGLWLLLLPTVQVPSQLAAWTRAAWRPTCRQRSGHGCDPSLMVSPHTVTSHLHSCELQSHRNRTRTLQNKGAFQRQSRAWTSRFHSSVFYHKVQLTTMGPPYWIMGAVMLTSSNICFKVQL